MSCRIAAMAFIFGASPSPPTSWKVLSRFDHSLLVFQVGAWAGIQLTTTGQCLCKRIQEVRFESNEMNMALNITATNGRR
jgi:hypothetical protein